MPTTAVTFVRRSRSPQPQTLAAAESSRPGLRRSVVLTISVSPSEHNGERRRLQVEFVQLDAGWTASRQCVSDDVTEPVAAARRGHVPPDQFAATVWSLVNCRTPLRIQVGAAVPGVGDEQRPVHDKRHRQRRAHARQPRLPRRLLEHPGIGVEKGRPELLHDVLLFRGLQVEEPAKGVEQESLNGHDGQGAGHLSAPVPAHAVGHDEDVSAVAAVLRSCLGDARPVDVERAGQLDDCEMIFVGWPDLTRVRQAEAAHPEGPRGYQVWSG